MSTICVKKEIYLESIFFIIFFLFFVVTICNICGGMWRFSCYTPQIAQIKETSIRKGSQGTAELSWVWGLSATHIMPTVHEEWSFCRAIGDGSKEMAPRRWLHVVYIMQDYKFNRSIFIKYFEILRVTQQHRIYIPIRESRPSEGRKGSLKQQQSKKE